MRKLQLIGEIFGRLRVISELPLKNKTSWWLCVCSCGNEHSSSGHNLRNGHVTSCGCFHKEMTSKQMSEMSTKHGRLTGKGMVRSYIIWRNMISRCTDTKDKRYADYGGRGITVCARWLEYPNFIDDMGEPPKGKTLERIENNDGYFLENCKWATRIEQGRNKRNNKIITFNGITQPLSAWSEYLGVNYCTLQSRFNYGWDVEKAFTTPIRQW